MARDRWPALPLGRAVSVAAVAALYVASSLLAPAAAFAAVNVPTLALLLGCMLISGVAEQHGAYAALEAAFAGGAPSPLALLLRVSGVAALSSAFITNDASCVVLTPLVLRACLARRLHPAPFLLALATSSNIGSSCSPIGNPQNMIIALFGALLFAPDFLRAVLAAALVGLAANAAVIALVYRRELFGGAEYEASPQQLASLGLEAPPAGELHQLHEEGSAAHGGAAGEGGEHGRGAAVVPSVAATAAAAAAATTVAVAVAPAPASAAPSLRRRLVYAVLLISPVLLIAADGWIGLSWMTLLLASLLLVIDGGLPDAALARVDAQLLLFFSGLFVVVAGFNATGLPKVAWDASVAAGVGVTGGAAGVALFAAVVTVGSNTVSNVPLVLLLAPSVAALPAASVRATWLLLAFISTVAGNLTLVGSVANLIVAERAKAAFELTFSEYARVGVPSTLLVLLVGTPIVWASCGA
jgi:Na+/H+ antiporter NhaD/arsenite permease-like protein